MFVSHPQYEFPVPDGLADPGAQHWRLIEFVLHAPWFMLTVDQSTEESGMLLTHTWCIAWERDLAQILATIDASKVQGLICMMPGWSSKAGQWTSREVCEVWLTRTDDAEELVRFIDVDGVEFDGGLQTALTAKVVQRKLLLQLKPKVVALRSRKARARRSPP